MRQGCTAMLGQKNVRMQLFLSPLPALSKLLRLQSFDRGGARCPLRVERRLPPPAHFDSVASQT